MKKERLKIGLVYVAISAVFLALCLWPVLGIWYPGIMPALFGLNKTLTIFIIANIVIFPILAAFVCKEDKKEQKRDIATLAVLQIVISGAMVYFLFQTRPVWSALVVDSFEIVRIKDLKDDGRDHISLADIEFFKPYQIVGASFSKDPEISKKQKTDDIFGTSVAWYPSAIVPLSEKLATLKQYAQPLGELKKYNLSEEVDAVLKKYPQATNYFPLRGFVKDGTMLTNKDFTWFQPVDLWPWEDDYPDPNSEEEKPKLKIEAQDPEPKPAAPLKAAQNPTNQ